MSPRHVDVDRYIDGPKMRTKVTPIKQLPDPCIVKTKTVKPGISFNQFQTIMYFEA